jgi:hypothetical protein
MVTILNGRKIDKESYDIFLKTLINSNGLYWSDRYWHDQKNSKLNKK